jgi:murein DD-endopeptidase MepM/ murein hydrolase activator NlpD
MTPDAGRRGAQNRIRASLLAVTAAAAVTSGGVAFGGGGGLGTPDPPVVRDARCVDRCLDLTSVAIGGRVELSGRNLAEVTTVRMPGEDGRVDARARNATAGTVQFVVPEGARSGEPVAVDAYGNRARSPVALDVQPASRVENPGDFTVKQASAAPSKSFYAAKKPSSVSYLFEAEKPTDVRIDVTKGKNEKLISSFVQRNRTPFAANKATWDGLRSNGKVAPNGKYSFAVRPVSGGSGARTGFKYYDHKFPLRAKHSYGDGLGAGRGHQGADVFARCGAPITAARGGKVQTRAYHSAAGYYMVIDGRKTGVDYAYMHLEKRGRPKLGARVRTGERIGYNSDTGNASGCHLHFEMWSAPGWYEGGKPLDAMPLLKRWDKWS